MGLESHVNQVLYNAGFKPSSWHWQFGDLIALNAPTARRIAVALNKSGEFGTARIDTGRHAVVLGRYRGPARAGGKRRKSGKRQAWTGREVGGPTSGLYRRVMPRILLPSGKLPAHLIEPTPEEAAAYERRRAKVLRHSGKRRHAATRPSGSLGAVVADINRLTK